MKVELKKIENYSEFREILNILCLYIDQTADLDAVELLKQAGDMYSSHYKEPIEATMMEAELMMGM